MARTYRLPRSLGGGECEIVQDRVDGYPGYVAVAVNKGRSVIVPRDWLVEVTPPLPEPEISEVVVVPDTHPGSIPDDVVFRHYVAGWSEPGRDPDGPGFRYLTWADVCALGTPVLLVPDPAAGTPRIGEWQCQFEDRDANLRVGPDPEGGWVAVFVFDARRVTQGKVFLSRDDAEAAGRTLLAAARSARAGA